MSWSGWLKGLGDNPARPIGLMGVATGLTAALVLILNAPPTDRQPDGPAGGSSAEPIADGTGAFTDTLLTGRSPNDLPPLPSTRSILDGTGAIGSPFTEEQDLELLLPWPPLLRPDQLAGRPDIQYTVLLPPDIEPRDLYHGGDRLYRHPSGAALRVDTADLEWGVNVVALTGATHFGTPVDRAWSLLVGDVELSPDTIVGAIQVRLAAEGFTDSDALADDFSSIARRMVEQAVRNLGEIDIGPAVARNLRVGITRLDLVPRPGRIEGHLYLELCHIDIEMGSVLTLTSVPIHRLWLDLSLGLSVDEEGRPVASVLEVEPHIDLVRSGEGAMAWVMDHAAWFLEIAGEVAAEEPIREAITGAIDGALSHWVDHLRFRTVAPLKPIEMTARYRFSRLDIDDGGLTALIDVGFDCPVTPRGTDGHTEGSRRAPSSDAGAERSDEAQVPVGQLVREYQRHFDALGALDPDRAVVQIGLHSDAVNAALHALWRCGALDSEVSLSGIRSSFPIAIPDTVNTRFRLPPVLQTGSQGEMAMGVPQVLADLDYLDARYEVVANAILPITLLEAVDGRALIIGFDPTLERIALHVDCIAMNGAPCRDNALFDRLAWMAIPLLPPIGASIPLPDVRLTGDPSQDVSLYLSRVHWYPESGLVEISGSYEMAGARE